MSRLRLHGAAVPSLVSPGALFNGTPNSGFGGSPPTISTVRNDSAPPRPEAYFIHESYQALISNLTIGVMARSTGSLVDHVEYLCEGTSVIVSTSTLATVATARGGTAKEDFYPLTLNAAAWLAKGPTGQGGNIYAKIVCVDPTYDPLIIGPFRVVPASGVDWNKTISPTGLDANGVATNYTTWTQAMTALATDNPRVPVLTCGLTANYEADNVTCSGFSPSWLSVRTLPGVTANFRRASAPSYASPSAWPWHVGRWRVRFEYGVKLDHLNFSDYHFDAVGSASLYDPAICFKGSYEYNSCAAVSGSPTFNMYWAAGPHPGCSTVNNSGAVGYVMIDSIRAYLQGLGGPLCALLKRTQLFEPFGNAYNNNQRMVLNCYDYNADIDLLTTGFSAMSVTCNKGGLTTATFEKSGSGGAGSIILKENGVAIDTFTFGVTPGAGTVFLVSEAVTRINTNTGWTAVTLNDTLRVAYLGSGSGPVAATNVYNVTPSFSTSIGVHTENMHVFGGNSTTTAEWNYLIYGNISWMGSYGTTSYSDETGLNDGYWVNNVNVPKIYGPTNGGLTYRTHLAFSLNIDDNGRGWFANAPGDTQSSYEGNVLYAQISIVPPLSAFATPIRYNRFSDFANSADLSTIGTGNVKTANATYQAMFENKAAGLFLPAVGSAWRSAMIPFPWEPYDQNYTPRDIASDWAGPYSKNYVGALPVMPTSPSYP